MRRLIATWMIPLLLLPNILFLVPVLPVSAATASQPSAPTTPLPAGTVTSNTGNNTSTCPQSQVATEPLDPTLGPWTTTLNIPTLLFDGQPTGSYITQHFSVFANGTLSVSDGAGNSFSVSIPLSTFSGKLSTRLVSNGTTAVQESLIGTGTSTTANVTLVYSTYEQFCQPA